MILSDTPPPHDETSAEYLKRVRAASNYKALRSLIGGIFFLLCAILWIGTALAVVGAIDAGLNLKTPDDPFGSIGTSIMTVILAVLITALLMAVQQGILLWIDLVDATLEANRRKRKES